MRLVSNEGEDGWGCWFCERGSDDSATNFHWGPTTVFMSDCPSDATFLNPSQCCGEEGTGSVWCPLWCTWLNIQDVCVKMLLEGLMISQNCEQNLRIVLNNVLFSGNRGLSWVANSSQKHSQPFPKNANKSQRQQKILGWAGFKQFYVSGDVLFSKFCHHNVFRNVMIRAATTVTHRKPQCCTHSLKQNWGFPQTKMEKKL